MEKMCQNFFMNQEHINEIKNIPVTLLVSISL